MVFSSRCGPKVPYLSRGQGRHRIADRTLTLNAHWGGPLILLSIVGINVDSDDRLSTGFEKIKHIRVLSWEALGAMHASGLYKRGYK